MIRKTLMSLMFGAAAVCSSTVSAGVIQFDTCFARCGEIDASFGDDVSVLASLEYTDDGNGGVLFVLTHTFSNGYAPDKGTFIADMFLNLAAEPTGFTGLTNNVRLIDIDFDNILNSGLTFDVDVDLKDSTSRRLLDGQSASWTFLGITEADIIGDAIVHIRDLPSFGGQAAGGRVKIIGSAGPSQSVPEPAGFLLLGAGLGLLGRRMVKRARK